MGKSRHGKGPFVADPPADAPAYHGFPLLEGSELDGFVFGTITQPPGDRTLNGGDAYVVAPDGSRAGIVWQAESFPNPDGDAFGPPIVEQPGPRRWGIYAFLFRHPVRTERDLITNLHECLPELQRYYERARGKSKS